MGIVNNQGVFIAPSLGEGEGTTLTSFREDDDFSTELFNESIVLPSFPNNVGIAFVNSSDSPADFATISLLGNNTSTIYVENTAGSANLAVSNDVYVGYKATSSGISSTGITGNLYVNGFIFGEFQDIRLRGTTKFGLNTIEINENNNSITGIESLNVLNSVGIGTTNPTEKLHIEGDFRLSGTVYDGLNNPGNNGDILAKTGLGYLQWIAQSSVQSGAGGVVRTIQYHNDIGLVDGNAEFVYDFNNNRVGIGTTAPEYTLDVRGDTNISGILSVVGVSTLNLTTNSVLIFGNTFEIGVTTTGVSTTGLTTISSLDSSLYRSARFQVQIQQGSDYQSTDIMVIHNGTTANLIEYGSISTNEYLSTFEVSLSGSNMILQILMYSESSANVSVARYALKTT